MALDDAAKMASKSIGSGGYCFFLFFSKLIKILRITQGLQISLITEVSLTPAEILESFFENIPRGKTCLLQLSGL